MKGQNQGQLLPLKGAMDRAGWRVPDLVAEMNRLAIQIGEPPPRLSDNHVGKWIRGDRNPSAFYGARLCVILDTDPASLGLSARPTLLLAIEQLKMKLAKRKQIAARSNLIANAMADGPVRNWGRLDHLIPQREPRVIDDLDRFATEYAHQLDTVNPTSLMPAVHELLQKERELGQRGLTPQLAAITCNSAIIAGWLSYNIHNRGDAAQFWSYAQDLAKEAGSAQLLAYVLGIRSCLFSGVPKRGEPWSDTSIPIALLDQAVSMGKDSTSPSLRAWLFARRAEEYAAIGNRRLAYQDITAAYRALGRQVPTGTETHVPILRTWHEARLARYHGSAAQLANEHRDAIQILTATLSKLDPSYFPQRAMAMTDLATVHAKKPDPDPERAAALLSEAIQLAQLGGLIEAIMRVMDARRFLQQWKDEPFVLRLDEQLRLR